ncbi:MAG: OB-fold nucleic acid binding domain-containing protein, partial [Clostridia bacterium]|nr:OB-fold nucleic acid binding domain-containing protein [Clostridia bacterium]
MDRITKNIYRDHSCGELNKKNVGEIVRLAGWVSNVRDHGGITFIDLRDHYGITQIIVRDISKFPKLQKETVISSSGKVVSRDDINKNPKLKTGDIEIEADSIEILGQCM